MKACMACGAPAECRTCDPCWFQWLKSGECQRLDSIPELLPQADTAFMDWVGRVRAERAHERDGR